MTASVIIGIVGLLFALALLVFLCYKGWDIMLVAFLCSLVVILTNAISWESIQAARQVAADALVASGGTDAAIAAAGPYTSFIAYFWDMLTKFGGGAGSFVTGYLLMFIFGSLFGQVMGDSGSAKAVALKLADWFGAKNAVIVVALATALLSYGGVNVFIVIFTVLPLANILFKQADIPRKLIVGATSLGAGTFTMTMLPGTPALTNIIPTRTLGTTATAAPVIGIVATVIMIVLGVLYLNRQEKKLRAAGEHFIPGPNDKDLDGEIDRSNLPNAFIAFLPMIIVIGILVPLSLIKSLAALIPATFAVVIALSLSILVCLLFNWKRFENKLKTVNTGLKNGVVPMIGIASIVGFGSIVAATVAFKAFVGIAMGLTFHPYISTGIAVNILAGITGSSSSGLQLFMTTLGPAFIEKGVNPEAFHRIASIAAGGLDSLPHSSAVVTTLLVCGLSHKEGYKYIGMICTVIPLIVLAVSIIMAIFMYPIA